MAIFTAIVASVCLLLIYQGWMSILNPFFLLSTGLTVFFIVCGRIAPARKEKEEEALKRNFDLSHLAWQASMANWNLTFYCSRCDHVFNIQSGKNAPSSQMRSIL